MVLLMLMDGLPGSYSCHEDPEGGTEETGPEDVPGPVFRPNMGPDVAASKTTGSNP